MKPTVIAFLGRAGSGKSTAAKYVIENMGAQRVSFAGPLKELARHLLELSEDQVYGSQEVKETVDPRYGFTPRQFLQRLGNGAREIISKDVWINAMLTTIQKSDSQLFVIDDCRYVNEAKLISESPEIRGFVIKLECPNAETSADPNHPSEAEVDQVPPGFISQTIVSSRSPGSADLLTKVRTVLEEFKVA